MASPVDEDDLLARYERALADVCDADLGPGRRREAAATLAELAPAIARRRAEQDGYDPPSAR